MKKDNVSQFYKDHKGEVIGTFIGALMGILFITVGFLKTLVVIFCTFAGYYIGRKLQNKEELLELLDRILPPGK